MFELDEAAELLDPSPLPIETGIHRLATGALHVAARTDMPACKGRMLEWWFRFAPDTRQYSWWHPLDHVSSEWTETSATTHIGSTHIVEERLGGSDEVFALQIHFVDPAELFGAEAVSQALDDGSVSAIIAAKTGIGPEPTRDELGRPNMGSIAHIARDTPQGMVLRSRFWLGLGGEMTQEERELVSPDAMGLQLMQHAHTEFKYLARFLPSLYLGENARAEGELMPW